MSCIMAKEKLVCEMLVTAAHQKCVLIQKTGTSHFVTMFSLPHPYTPTSPSLLYINHFTLRIQSIFSPNITHL